MASEQNEEGAVVAGGQGSTLGQGNIVGTHPFEMQSHRFSSPNYNLTNSFQRGEVGAQSLMELMQSDGNSRASFDQMSIRADQGNFGSFQGLLNSFSQRLPVGAYSQLYGANLYHGPSAPDCSFSKGFDFGESVREESPPSDEPVLCADTPERIHVDESGYESSDSSVYAVPSDDEEYERDDAMVSSVIDDILNNKTSAPVDSDDSGDDEDGGLELPRAAVEDGPRACCQSDTADGVEVLVQDTVGTVCPPNKQCPCMEDKPFLHVLAPGYYGDGTGAIETPWKRRNRKKMTDESRNCRVARGLCPAEIALRNAPYRKTKYIFEPILGLTFDSENEAYDFYNMYSWEVGFGIKKSCRPHRNERGYHTQRDLRCLCSGVGDTAKYKTKKTNYKAMLRLLRTEDDGWFISQHVKEHNHPLTETCGQKQEWFSHGRIDQCAMDMIKYLRENKVSLAKVQCIMGSMFGSMDNAPVTKRSMRAICNKIAKDQMDDDVHKTLAVFREIRQQDPEFQFSVEPSKKNQINSLLWVNGKSREQYKCFGDVICFDTTYCTNIYKMPFGLFVGVNNHFQTTIFGGVFMKEETTESFSWVFKEFASLMGGVEPETVFTDQCAAMAAALRKTWKKTVHLLCKWHLFKDARAKFGAKYKKGSPFRKLFHKIINDMMTVDEFEKAWAYMLAEHKLEDNEYLRNIYSKRMQWAKPYLRVFCARIASTQRSESANHMLKRYVPRNCSMNRFVVQFNKLLFDRNSEEDIAEFDTAIRNDVRERAWPIEEHASKVYTSAVYALFRKQVSRSTFYVAVETVEKKEFAIVHVKPERRLPWGREKFTVSIDPDQGKYECECGQYRHFGILCSHAIRVLIHLGVYEVPESYIKKRWTRSARDILPDKTKGYQKETLRLHSMTFRHNFLYVNAIDVVQDGNKDLVAFDIASKYLKKAQKKLKAYFLEKEKNPVIANQGLFVSKEAFYPSETDRPAESEFDREGTTMNTYGASGSSAWMSDSELMKLKAPPVVRKVGRPTELRNKGTSDYYASKGKRYKSATMDQRESNGKTLNKKKKVSRCHGCHILGHTKAQCKKKLVDVSTDLPEF